MMYVESSAWHAVFLTNVYGSSTSSWLLFLYIFLYIPGGRGEFKHSLKGSMVSGYNATLTGRHIFDKSISYKDDNDN